MEIIESRLQPVDVAKVLGIDKKVFINLPQYEKIRLLRLVYSGRIFQDNESYE